MPICIDTWFIYGNKIKKERNLNNGKIWVRKHQ